MSALPRPSFNSSQLIRFLADLDRFDVAPSKQTFAESLSLWMDWTDAISLSAALNSAGTDAPLATSSAASGVIDEATRTRMELTRAISRDPDAEADGSAWRSRHLAQQRAMETRIGPLRARVRRALQGMSPRLARLAALDAVLDKALADRERRLLAKVPALLAQHFERRAAAGASAADASAADAQAYWRHCTRTALLAELALRWQPIEGLIEAMNSEKTIHS